MSDEITTPQEDMPQDRSAESEVSAESHSAYKVLQVQHRTLDISAY